MHIEEGKANKLFLAKMYPKNELFKTREYIDAARYANGEFRAMLDLFHTRRGAMADPISVLMYILEDLSAPELCLAAVQEHGHSITVVPSKHRTPELCLVAMRKNGNALRHLLGPPGSGSSRMTSSSNDTIFSASKKLADCE